MATGDNPITPLLEPGDRFSAAITTAVVAGTFVRPSAGFQGGPPLSINAALTGGNLPQVATCGAGLKASGVAVTDGAMAGDAIGIIGIRSGMIVPMVAGAAITVGAEVESDASGRPVTLAAGRPNGMTLNAAAGAGSTVYVQVG